MGWNDHVEYLETYCEDCGVEDSWPYWSEIGKARYTGALGEFLHVDPTKSGKCPHCGSTNGNIIDHDAWLYEPEE